MRVLIIHNRYRATGGEERAVADLEAMLARHGHTVARLQRASAGTERGRAARGMLTGGLEPGEVEAAARALEADVVHAHNLHPTLGFRALAAGRRAGARTVLHLHNYRLYCAIGVAWRDGAPCHQCHGHDTWPGVRHRCRGSLPEAAVYALGLRRQQDALLRQADRIVTVSQAQTDTLRRFGLSAQRATPLLNFLPDASFVAQADPGPGVHALAVGRLVPEKGFDTAIAAARAARVPLVVAGDGPDGPRLKALAAGAEVRFTGQITGQAVAALRAQASVVLAPSRWEEPCPYAVAEAMAAGVPVLASQRGGLPEMVGAEMTLPAGDVGAWAAALTTLHADPQARSRAARHALARARELFDETRYHARLMEVYGAGPSDGD
ncbi:MAG TPA: glycosyltransferase family 4 protein [Solirubrobacteraceae bacterium]|nr:glycosyltransferase family 4 protein [Solirubrobacteraceae bacterium]